MKINIIATKNFQFEADTEDIQEAVDNAVGTFLHAFAFEDEEGNIQGFPWDNVEVSLAAD